VPYQLNLFTIPKAESTIRNYTLPIPIPIISKKTFTSINFKAKKNYGYQKSVLELRNYQCALNFARSSCLTPCPNQICFSVAGNSNKMLQGRQSTGSTCSISFRSPQTSSIRVAIPHPPASVVLRQGTSDRIRGSI